jgi:hypothetical protein
MEPAKVPNRPAADQPLTDLRRGTPIRRTIAVGIASCVLIYLALVVCNVVSEKDRLNAVDIVLLAMAGLVIAILLFPNFVERIAKLKIRDFEIDLHRIQKDQQEQKEELDGIRFVLTLLLKTEELQHLRNLKSNPENGYIGNVSVRAELGKLLDLRLIERLPGRHLREFRDNARVELGHIVRLTPRGEDFLRRLPDFKPEAAET